MNAAIMCFYNTTDAQLELTKQAVESVFAQDIPVHLMVINNGSTEPETAAWMAGLAVPSPHELEIATMETNTSPVWITNTVLRRMFDGGVKYVLGIPNDVVLPSNLYREFLRWPVGIVTGSMTAEIEFQRVEESHAVNTCTPMAVALIRRWCHDALIAKDGYFLDPRYFHYASDNDMALRIAACGIRGVQLDIPYFHSGSASHRLADSVTAKIITDQADVDRAAFIAKWGFGVTDERYGQSCGNINFRGESR